MQSLSASIPGTNLYEIAPTPTWVDGTLLDKQALQTSHSAPLHYLLLTYQSQVCPNVESNYSRRVFQVNDASKLEESSQILSTLSPDCDRIQFHHCRIIRQTAVIDCLEFPQIRALHRETGLERQHSSDRMTVELLIDDLRAGDIVDVAHTIVTTAGEHPLYGRFFHDISWLKWGLPVDELHIQIINRSLKPITLNHKDSANDIDTLSTIEPGQTETLTRHQLQAQHALNYLPHTWWDDCLIATTADSWESISAQLFDSYTQTGVHVDDLNDALIADIGDIDWQSKDTDNVTQLVRFVQNQIRYRSESSGIHTHTPRPASETLRRRTGDCKAKSALLMVLLARLGIDAHLALVHSGRREGIAELQPSPFWFDHMVVRFEHEGEIILIDSTIQKQGGTILNQTVTDFRWCLPIIEGGSSIMPVAEPPRLLLLDRKDVLDLEHDTLNECTLSIERHYYAQRADNMRFYFDATQAESLHKDFLDFTREEYSVELEIIEGIAVSEDNLLGNHITTTELYRLSGNEKDSFQFKITPFDDYLTPKDDDRPFYACQPCRTKHELVVRYGSKADRTNTSHEEKNPLFHYKDAVWNEGNTIRSTTQFEAIAEVVPAKDIANCREAVQELQQRCVTTFPLKVHKEAATSLSSHLWYIVPLIHVCFITHLFINRSPAAAWFYVKLLGLSSLLYWLYKEHQPTRNAITSAWNSLLGKPKHTDKKKEF